jgi:predicted DNA-binding antitoxin AbrB/MazE fold protein
MTLTIRAVYEAGNLRLLDNVNLSEGQEVTVIIAASELQRQIALEEEIGKLRAVLQEEEYPGEQTETFNFLKQALDEDRPADRKLFP